MNSHPKENKSFNLNNDTIAQGTSLNNTKMVISGDTTHMNISETENTANAAATVIDNNNAPTLQLSSQKTFISIHDSTIASAESGPFIDYPVFIPSVGDDYNIPGIEEGDNKGLIKPTGDRTLVIEYQAPPEESTSISSSLGYYLIDKDGNIDETVIMWGNLKAYDYNAFGNPVYETIIPGGMELGFFVLHAGDVPFQDPGSVEEGLDFWNVTENRVANINDSYEDITLLIDGEDILARHEDNLGGVPIDLFHSVSGNLNEGNYIRTFSGLPPEEGSDGYTVRVGFEDSPDLSGRDYNDIVFDVTLDSTPTYQPVYTSEAIPLFANSIAIHDGDSSDFISGASIRIQKGASNDQFFLDTEQFHVLNGEIYYADQKNHAGTINTSTGVSLTSQTNEMLVFEGSANTAIYEDIFNHIMFLNNSQTPGLRSFEVSLSDNMGVHSITETFELDVIAPHVIHGTPLLNELLIGKEATVNAIYGYHGNDIITGGKQNDYLVGGLGQDIIYGGEGADKIVFTNLSDSLPENEDLIKNFARGEDSIDFSSINEINSINDLTLSYDDFSGIATVTYQNSFNTFILKVESNSPLQEDDFLFTTPQESPDNRIDGSKNSDDILGTLENDVISGKSGDDMINGKAGNDILYGNLGNDLIKGKSGDDFIEGGSGHDIIYGDAGWDKIDGGYGKDTIYGGSGADIIYGGGGADIIYGGQGADTIYGGLGKDIIDGGAGSDTISFSGLEDSVLGKEDLIQNFIHGEDSIDLSNIKEISSIDDLSFHYSSADNINTVTYNNGIDDIFAFKVESNTMLTSSDFDF